jgi:hypothetical protein
VRATRAQPTKAEIAAIIDDAACDHMALCFLLDEIDRHAQVVHQLSTTAFQYLRRIEDRRARTRGEDRGTESA